MEDLIKGKNGVRRRLLDILLRLGWGQSLLLGTCLRIFRRGLRCHTQGVGSGEGAGRRGRGLGQGRRRRHRGGEVEVEVDGEIGRRVRGEDGEPKTWKLVLRRRLERPGRMRRQGLEPRRGEGGGRRPNGRNDTRRRGSRGRGRRRRGGDQINREGGDDDDDESDSESESDDNNNSNDADPNDLTGKYDGEGKKKGKVGRRRYREEK